MDATPRNRRAAGWLFALGGALVGGALLFTFLRPAPGFVERIQKRPRAPDDEVAAWTREWERRAAPHGAFPDPPGEGPVLVERYWVSLPAYEMEVRRRGSRVTLGIRGVDVQTLGGGWTAFGEGRIVGPSHTFSNAVATITWSCLGIRFRAASDGVARLSFSSDASSVVAVYTAYEFWAAPLPDLFTKVYGTRIRGERPKYGEVLGQIPYLGAMPRLRDAARAHVAGRVLTPDGVPVADALVQLKGVDRTRTLSDADGRFRIAFRGRDAPYVACVCAGAIGHRNGESAVFTGDPVDDVVIECTPTDAADHPDYAWIHPAPDRDPDDAMACGTCHSWQYTEWMGSRHARMAQHGHVSWVRARALSAGATDDCADCHQPAAAATAPIEYQARGLLAGAHCDFCHKVRGLGDVTASGVRGGLFLARPDPASRERPGSIHRVFGPAADATFAYMGAEYAPHLSTSFFCGACHQGGAGADRPKLNTFEEWRTWAAGRENEEFRSCQDCHMPGATTISDEGARLDLFAWESLHRDANAVHSHAFQGTEAAFAAKALRVEVSKAYDETAKAWRVRVVLENVGAGHAIPTGTATKHVAVGVWARQGETWLRATPDTPRARLGAAASDEADVALRGGVWRDPPGTVLGLLRGDEQGSPMDFWSGPDAGPVVDTRLQPGTPRELLVAFLPATEGERGAQPTVEVRVVHRRGAIGEGPASTPWPVRANDPSPQTEWTRIER